MTVQTTRMPAAPTAAPSLLLVFGEDDVAVKNYARQQFDQWCADAGGDDHEIVDGHATNSDEAFRSVRRVREALQTLPFFGGAKVIWWRGCSFLGDDRTASSQAVTESLQDLAQLLKEFNWTGVRLLISAGKVDKRKTFYKTVDKCGATKIFTAWSLDTRGWEAEAESLARQTLRTQQVTLSDQALSELIECVGPNRPQLLQELEKLTLYAGDRREITSEDIEAVVTRTKQARAFALADALGERNLPRLLRTLEEDLWEVKLDRQRSEIGLLYGLISKVRMMILAKEMVREKLVQPGLDSHRLKAQLQRVAPEHFPEDSRFNPLAMNPYPLAKAMQHAENYTTDELVQAMQLLLEGNLRLIFSSLDGSVVLQQTLVQIVGQPAARPAAGRR